MTHQMLKGVRVVDLTHLGAGPLAGRYLADLGADVIKIEAPGGGDVARTLMPIGRETSALFEHCNQHKRSVAIDLKQPEGVELLHDLIRESDVFISNFRPHFLERIAVDWPRIQELRPGIIAAYVTGYGMTDERSNAASGDVIAQAESGLSHFLGEPDRGPLLGIGAPADAVGATQAALGVLAALSARGLGNSEGIMIDISILDAFIWTDLLMMPMVAATNGAFRPERQGMYHRSVFPHGVFRARREYVTISAYGAGPQGHWPRLARAMDRQDLADDPAYATDDLRSGRRDELIPLIENWLATFDSAQDAVDVLRSHGLTAGRVMEPAEVAQDARARQRGIFQEVDHPTAGTISLVGGPLLYNGETAKAAPAPSRGAHTEEVLRDVLRLAPGRIREFQEVGVVDLVEPGKMMNDVENRR